jgi:hypothetical protein
MSTPAIGPRSAILCNNPPCSLNDFDEGHDAPEVMADRDAIGSSA